MRVKGEILEYLGGMKELTPLEYSIMKFVWGYQGDVQSSEIYESFPQTRSTLSTAVHKLSGKGYLANTQIGLHHVYTALVSELEYERALLKQKIKNVTGNGSFEHLVAAFYGKERLNEKQLKKMHDLIREFEDTIDDE